MRTLSISRFIWGYGKSEMGDVYGRAKAVAVHPYRLKVNPETYTISKGDLILKVKMDLLGRLTNVNLIATSRNIQAVRITL